jgi:hypothetical protein
LGRFILASYTDPHKNPSNILKVHLWNYERQLIFFKALIVVSLASVFQYHGCGYCQDCLKITHNIETHSVDKPIKDIFAIICVLAGIKISSGYLCPVLCFGMVRGNDITTGAGNQVRLTLNQAKTNQLGL